MKYPNFSTLRLTRDLETDEIEFDEPALMAAADAMGETITGPDDVGRVLHQWYTAHRAAGGAPDPVAEDLFWEAVEEHDSPHHYDLPVEPPLPGDIRAMRLQYGLTQPQAAALAGVAVQTWKNYEAPIMLERNRRPITAVWGLFLLSIGQHPRYSVTTK